MIKAKTSIEKRMFDFAETCMFLLLTSSSLLSVGLSHFLSLIIQVYHTETKLLSIDINDAMKFDLDMVECLYLRGRMYLLELLFPSFYVSLFLFLSRLFSSILHEDIQIKVGIPKLYKILTKL